MKSGYRRPQGWCPHTGGRNQVLGLEPTHWQALLDPGVWLQGLSALLVDGLLPDIAGGKIHGILEFVLSCQCARLGPSLSQVRI